MDLLEFEDYFTDSLKTSFDENTIKQFFRIYKEDLFDVDRDQKLIDEDILRIKNGEPIQYVTGKTNFYGFEFLVSPAVLIPRCETEELVYWVLQSTDLQRSNLKVLDIGTGSGVIPICLKKKKPAWLLSAMDISDSALELAQRNANAHQLEINFICQDFLNDSAWGEEQWDVIVSNPPYIGKEEAELMDDHVIKHEPEIALFADDPLIFYKEILKFARQNLKKDGLIYLEINEFRVEALTNLYKDAFENLEFKKDMQGKVRMLKLSRPLF